ncbi:hypothetical protein ABFA25_13000 [Mycobacterium lepromatosis]
MTAQKPSGRYVDALVWTPAHLVAEVSISFSDIEAVALTFDIMRKAGP